MADRFVVGDTVTLTNTFAVSGTNTPDGVTGGHARWGLREST